MHPVLLAPVHALDTALQVPAFAVVPWGVACGNVYSM